MTVSQDRLPQSILGMDKPKIRQFVIDRLTGSSVAPILGNREELPHEAVVQLLRSDLKGGKKTGVIEGCAEVAAKIFEHFASPKSKMDSDIANTTSAWAAVMDRTAPEELKAVTLGLLQLALRKPDAPLALRDAMIRAAMRFRLEEQDAELWLQVVNERELCAYGFNALLKINSEHERVVSSLLTLWDKHVSEGWDVNVEHLTARFLGHKGAEQTLAMHLATPLNLALFEKISARLAFSRIEALRNFAQGFSSRKSASSFSLKPLRPAPHKRAYIPRLGNYVMVKSDILKRHIGLSKGGEIIASELIDSIKKSLKTPGKPLSIKFEDGTSIFAQHESVENLEIPISNKSIEVFTFIVTEPKSINIADLSTPGAKALKKRATRQREKA